MSTCLGCGEPLVERHQKVFCSNACQRALERRQRTEEWLAGATVGVAGNHRHFVRLYVLDQQGGRCAICGQDGEWNGVHLALVLDHIDGDASNNRRDNLRLVCPNCKRSWRSRLLSAPNGPIPLNVTWTLPGYVPAKVAVKR